MASLPPPPIRDKFGSYTWEDWFRKIRASLTTAGSLAWTLLDFTSSTITNIVDRKHNDLQNIQGGTSAEYYHLTSAQHTNLTGTSTTFTEVKVGDNLVLSKTAGEGIKVGTTTPTFGWKDLFDNVIPKTSGVGSPTLAVFRGGNVRAYAFAAGDDYDGQFHIPHDYVPGTDIYLHVHWAHNGTAISGNLVLDWGLTYAKGHGQANFPTEVNNTQTISTPDIATIPQYNHRIEEIQISVAGGSGTQLNSTNFEPDGVIMFHMDATTIPTITGGSPNKPFILYVDIHYQTLVSPTKNKSPNFYT